MKKTLPQYKAKLDKYDSGLYSIALVEEGAMDFDFSLEEKVYNINQDHRIITYPLIIKDKPIYRGGEKEYYIIYDGDTILEILKKYHTNKTTTFNEQHTDKMIDNISLLEIWIKGEEDKSNQLGFKDVPVGSLMVSLYCDDENYWEKIKSGEDFNGLSMEIYNSIELYENNTEMDDFYKLLDKMTDEEVLEFIKDFIK